MKQIEKYKLIIALFAGSVFSVSFIVSTDVSADLLLRILPSENADDVRFDLLLLIYLTAYVSASLMSYLAGAIFARLINKKLPFKSHITFVVIVPILFLIAYLLVFIILSAFLAIGFHIEWVDIAIGYFILFTTMIIGYYYILKRTKN